MPLEHIVYVNALIGGVALTIFTTLIGMSGLVAINLMRRLLGTAGD
jgi:hypothetical protein